MCFGLSANMYSIKLVEGRDWPHQSPPKKFEEKGKTARLLLRLCESIMHSGIVVFMVSGFCVLQALKELLLVGVNSSAVI